MQALFCIEIHIPGGDGDGRTAVMVQLVAAYVFAPIHDATAVGHQQYHNPATERMIFVLDPRINMTAVIHGYNCLPEQSQDTPTSFGPAHCSMYINERVISAISLSIHRPFNVESTARLLQQAEVGWFDLW